MEHPPVLREIASIADMCRILTLSRTRFYELVKERIFPEPSRNPETNRPFYNREQQEMCLLIRKTNKGANGKAVLFYTRQAVSTPAPKKPAPKPKPFRICRREPARSPADPLIEELRHGLQQLGLAETTPATIRAALADEYPDGHSGVENSAILLSVFRNLKNSRNTPDNVAR